MNSGLTEPLPVWAHGIVFVYFDSRQCKQKQCHVLLRHHYRTILYAHNNSGKNSKICLKVMLHLLVNTEYFDWFHFIFCSSEMCRYISLIWSQKIVESSKIIIIFGIREFNKVYKQSFWPIPLLYFASWLWLVWRERGGATRGKGRENGSERKFPSPAPTSYLGE